MTQTALAVINLAEHRAQADIARGIQSWRNLTGTAAEQRFWWFDVGVALTRGKTAENRPYLGLNKDRSAKHQKFSDWVADCFPGLKSETTITDAIWFAAFFARLAEIPAELTSPTTIREWSRRQPAQAAITETFGDTPPPTSKPVLEPRTAVRVGKVHKRALSGGEGADIADSALKAYARQYGTTVEALVQAANSIRAVLNV